jgi:hypothetical protein
MYDASGSLASEIGLSSVEESSPTRLTVHDILGGAAANGSYAWTLDRKRFFDVSRSKSFGSKRLLTVFGTAGSEIWTSTEADAPLGRDPVIFSDDAQTLLVSYHSGKSWRVSVQGPLGDIRLNLGPFDELDAMDLSPNGRYAMIRWKILEQKATHSFVNIATHARRDVPSFLLHLGRAELKPDGKVFSGDEFVLDLSALRPSK